MNTATELLTQIRAATKMSQKALATRLRVSQPTVNRILKGQPDCKGATLTAIVALHAEIATQGRPGSPPVSTAASEVG
ncbi:MULTISPECIES: helix-turn-helix transcriptional regulator [unclassified Paraburkholderia]|uniref:helix-turn-helix domain-containing protein n=1 Tax=unclassified Paraburkholderia TaxID=2615204 RepID=UPI001622FB36|nr:MULTISPECIES: helix-turn-helix transcriptional regulator [unclassified Paraburkholderia]MBB5443656.1 transcriptional regulator with XRE-family HTH domain [Paraburkholderia sp. WSM4177]MBB5484123.1 transcriptional regulator with XRE-family HTH domain [Paraburkholderia sp. WSM4180]